MPLVKPFSFIITYLIVLIICDWEVPRSFWWSWAHWCFGWFFFFFFYFHLSQPTKKPKKTKNLNAVSKRNKQSTSFRLGQGASMQFRGLFWAGFCSRRLCRFLFPRPMQPQRTWRWPRQSQRVCLMLLRNKRLHLNPYHCFNHVAFNVKMSCSCPLHIVLFSSFFSFFFFFFLHVGANWVVWDFWFDMQAKICGPTFFAQHLVLWFLVVCATCTVSRNEQIFLILMKWLI